MWTDAILAIIHHCAAFGLMAVLAMQWALLRQEPTTAKIHRLARLNLLLWLMAAVMIGGGILRLLYGAKGAGFLLHNPLFHAKLTIFAVILLLAHLPARRFRAWKRASLADPTWQVPPGQWRTTHHVLAAEFHLLLILPVLAALSARGIGLG